MVVVRCGSVCSVNGASKRGKESGNRVAGRVAFGLVWLPRYVSCWLSLVCLLLDGGAMVAVGRGPVWFSGMFGYLIPCFGCGMPFEFGWLWFGVVSKWGKQAG